MMAALNIGYGQTETRGYVGVHATACFLTVLIIASGLITLMLVSGLPALLSGTGVRSPAGCTRPGYRMGASDCVCWVVSVSGELPLRTRREQTTMEIGFPWDHDGHHSMVDWVDPVQRLCPRLRPL